MSRMDHLSSDSCEEETGEEEKIEVRVDSCLICAQVAATYDVQGNIIKREDSLPRDKTRKWSSDQLFTVLCRSLEIRVKKLYSPLFQLEHLCVCDTCERLINSLAEVYSKLEELQNDLRRKVVEAEKLFERDVLYEKHCPAYQKFRKDALEAYQKGAKGRQCRIISNKVAKPETTARETILPHSSDSSHDEEEEVVTEAPTTDTISTSSTRTPRRRTNVVQNITEQSECSSNSNPFNVDEMEETSIPSPTDSVDQPSDSSNEEDEDGDDYKMGKQEKRKYKKRKKIACLKEDKAEKSKKRRKKSSPFTKRTPQSSRTVYKGTSAIYLERDPVTGSLSYTTGYGNRFKNVRTTLIFSRITRDDGKMGYQCTTCSESISSLPNMRKQEGLFRQHYLTSHSDRYKCRLCPNTPNYSNRSKLFEHLKESHGISTMARYHITIGNNKAKVTTPRDCEICGMPISIDGRKFYYKSHLQTHMNDEEKKEALILDAPRYKQLSSLPVSASSCTSGLINQCESCGQFITNGEIGMFHHIQDSHPELEESQVKPFLCTICGLSLSCKTSLENHTRKKHPDGKIDDPFKCRFPACPGNLNDESSLKDHVELEHGQSDEARNRVLCMICGRVMAFACNLKSHGLTHSGERAHKCHLCPKAFALKDTLDGHLTAKHGIGVDIFKCEQEGCGKVFPSRKYWRFHMINAHKLYTKRTVGKQKNTD